MKTLTTGATEEDTHMVNRPPYPDSKDDTGVGPDHGSTTGTLRWVKVFGIIALVVVLPVVVMMVAGGGERGPGSHTPGGHTPPEGAHP